MQVTKTVEETRKQIKAWKKEGKTFKKEIERRKMIAPFENLIKEFKNNNEISKKLVKVIPVATEIHINWDCTADVNRVYYTIEGVTKSIPIIGAHSIVWTKLKELCTEEKE